MDNERKKAVNETMKSINKKLGKNFFTTADESPDKEVIKFGVNSIDNFCGGGVSRRKYFVDFGVEDTGKSTRALQLVANAQKQGLVCAYIDLERKFDKVRARELDVDTSSLFLNQNAKTAEEAMDAIRFLAEEKTVDLVVCDSIQAMSPKGEQETKKGKQKSIEDDEMALLARKLGKFFRVTSADVFNANMAVYMIGQVRQNLGGFVAFADLSGGNSLKHWMSFCMFSRKGQKTNAPVIKEREYFLDPDGKLRSKLVKKPIGFDCVLKVVKSHIRDSAMEGENINIPFLFKKGFVNEIIESEKIPITIDPTMSEEDKVKCELMMMEKGIIEKKDIPQLIVEESEKLGLYDEKIKKGIQEAKEGKLIDAKEDYSKYVTTQDSEKKEVCDKPKSKRGRPKKKKD